MNRVVKRAQSVVSDQEANDGLAEIELQKLQRQYRIMEGDRKAYSDESRALIKKQRSTLDQLKNDNLYLAEEIKLVEARLEASRHIGRGSKKAEALNEQLELYARKIRTATTHVHDLDEDIKKLDKEITNQRQKVGGVDATASNVAINKQIRVLENRLDKALVKFNKSLADNKTLRGFIDNLRRERAMFDNVHRKLEKELLEQKKQMAEIIEASNSAYEARDEAQTKIVALKEKADKEYQAYIQEVKELDRILEQDRKLKNFMAIKASERNENVTQEERTLKKASNDKDSAGNKGSQENIAETVEDYELAFAKIKEVTNTSDIHELVKRFTQVEDQNFSLFNYVNEINNEIEKLSEEIADITRQIEKYEIDAVASDNERKSKLKELEEKLRNCNEKSAQYESQYTATACILQDLRGGIDELFAKIMPDQSVQASRSVSNVATEQETPAGEGAAADDDSSSNDLNLMRALSTIEAKTNELLMASFMIGFPKKEDSYMATPFVLGGVAGQGPTAPIGNISIVAPSTGEDYDSEDDLSEEDDRPLTREELKQKTLRGITRREKAGPNSKPQKSNRKKAANARDA